MLAEICVPKKCLKLSILLVFVHSIYNGACLFREHWKKKWSHFDLKIESLAQLKFDPRFRVIGEYLNQIIVNLTLNIESIWLSISSQFTLNIESIRLSISSQFDSQYRVNSTLNIESIRLKYYPIIHNLGSNFSSACDSKFQVKMTPFFLSVHFHCLLIIMEPLKGFACRQPLNVKGITSKRSVKSLEDKHYSHFRTFCS